MKGKIKKQKEVSIKNNNKTYKIKIEKELLEKWEKRFGQKELKRFLLTLVKTDIKELQ